MRLVLLGPPGAGKGTHAKLLSEKYSVPQLATGDIFRRNIREKTELGCKAQATIERGGLVSDDLVNEMMFNELEQSREKSGFILDGYPRTIGQAEALDGFIKKSVIYNKIYLQTCQETDYLPETLPNWENYEDDDVTWSMFQTMMSHAIEYKQHKRLKK